MLSYRLKISSSRTSKKNNQGKSIMQTPKEEMAGAIAVFYENPAEANRLIMATITEKRLTDKDVEYLLKAEQGLRDKRVASGNKKLRELTYLKTMLQEMRSSVGADRFLEARVSKATGQYGRIKSKW